MIDTYVNLLAEIEPARLVGRVRRVSGAVAECDGLRAPVGSLCEILPYGLRAEVVGFRDDVAVVIALGDTAGVRAGDTVMTVAGALRVPVGDGLIGRVIDAEGRPLDGGVPPAAAARVPLMRAAPAAMDRVRGTVAVATGVRAIDGMLPVARGQRVGLFSGSGVGKTTLLAMIARGA